MILGDGTNWLAVFKGFDARFIERLCCIVPETVQILGPNPEEDDITHNLRMRFHLDPTLRRMFYSWETQFEPPGLAETGKHVRDGIIDLVLFWDQSPTCYLAYEAKRLNVTMPSGFKALSGKYVSEGLARYVTGKYSEGLPFGGMLGYVLDGDLPAASTRIGKVLAVKSIPLALQSGPEELSTSATALRFQTRHLRQSGGEIDVVHSLIDCHLSQGEDS